jgi:hypothetical protein
VDVALVEATDARGPHGPGGEHLHRAGVLEAIQDPPYGVVLKSLRHDRLPHQEGRSWVCQERCPALQGTPAAQGIEAQAQHTRPWIDGPRGWHHLLEGCYEAALVRIGLPKGQRVDGGRFARREHEPPTTLQGRRRGVSRLACDDHRPLLGGAVRAKNAPGNGCDRAIPSPNRLTERFAYKIKRLPKNVALLYSPGSHANELDADP